MGSQKTVMTVLVNAVYLLQIDAFYSFSGTYFFSISGEKLNKPSDSQVVLMPHRPPLSLFPQTIKHYHLTFSVAVRLSLKRILRQPY